MKSTGTPSVKPALYEQVLMTFTEWKGMWVVASHLLYRHGNREHNNAPCMIMHIQHIVQLTNKDCSIHIIHQAYVHIHTLQSICVYCM